MYFSDRSTPWVCKLHPVFDILTTGMCVVMTWCLMYMFFQMSSESHLTSVMLLVTFSWTSGKIVGALGLPPLLGMLLAGIVLRNTNHYDMKNNVFQPHIINLRSDILLLQETITRCRFTML